MKTPKRLLPLIEDGLVDHVISRLMSGKEADVFIVQCGNEVRCAKIYKDTKNRSFKQAAQYQEGRKSRSSRRGRAMDKGSKFGREQREETWQNAEVDALGRLDRAGVRVPKTYGCIDGVLLMELIIDEDGDAAPRLSDVTLTIEQALAHHTVVMKNVMQMLCAGIIHGDLSEFNILVDEIGPVIIDLPQAVDAAANNNAERMFHRDVDNVTRFYAQFAPALQDTRFAHEIWAIYESGDLHPDTRLTGFFEVATESADVDGVLIEIDAAREEELERQERMLIAETDGIS